MTFKIAPDPKAARPLAILLAILAFETGVIAFFAQDWDRRIFTGASVVFICLAAELVYSTLMKAKRGARFEFNRTTGKVSIPQSRVQCEIGDVRRLELDTLEFKGEPAGELFIVVRSEGTTQRHRLVEQMLHSHFKQQIEQIAEVLNVPVEEHVRP